MLSFSPEQSFHGYSSVPFILTILLILYKSKIIWYLNLILKGKLTLMEARKDEPSKTSV